MSVVLLANVGLRDVLLEGRPIEPARSGGQRIREELSSHEAQLALPMLAPVVAHLLRAHTTIQVVLYGTDQPDTTMSAHRDRDTLCLAQIAVELLKGRSKIDQASRAKAIPGNPSLYDDMLVFFRDQLSPSRQKWVAEVDVCYVYPVGGTPAANTGLMLAAIERFGERCVTLYLPHGETRPVEMDVGQQIQRSLARRLAAEQLRGLSFDAAVPLLEKAETAGWLVEVARYAADRYHFDFESAAGRLEDARRRCGDDLRSRAECDRLRRGLLGLRDRDLPALLRELYHNARMAWERSEFAAFLGLVFRFQEAMLRYMVEELYPGLDTDVDDAPSRKRFREGIEGRPGLLAHLKAQRINGCPISYDRTSRLLFEIMVRYAWTGPEVPTSPERLEQQQGACALSDRFDCLSGLRNKSVIAHGFEGVSKARILEIYASKGFTTIPLDDMASCLEALGVLVGKSPFEEAAELVREALEKR